MAFSAWKDRVTATPHRYKLTEVATDTYDFEAVPGAVSEAGTPVNAENLDKLIQRDGDDIKDTVVAFTEAGARANIATGEKTATLFGKVKKYFTDLKAHSFVAPSTTQGTGTTTVPCDNLLTQSSFARVYREKTDFTYDNATVTFPDFAKLVTVNFSKVAIRLWSADVPGVKPIAAQSGTLYLTRVAQDAIWGKWVTSGRSTTDLKLYNYETYIATNDTDDKWCGWKQVLTSPDSIETTQSTSAVKVPSSNLLKESSFARVYREATEISGITYPVTIGALVKAIMDANIVNCYLCIGMNAATETKVTGLPLIGATPQTYGTLTIITGSTSALRMRIEYNKEVGNDTTLMWIGSINRGTTPYTVTWKQVIDDSTAQTISAIKTYSVSPLVPTTPSGASAAVAKAYADSLRTVYDKVIRTQTEFEALIASATWLDAKSVAFVGAFTLSTNNNHGVKIPATVKQIHGFNSAKITITNFVFDLDTAKGGLWYDTAPTTQDYSIRDLEVSCTGADGYGFANCINLSNCTVTGTGSGAGTSYGFGFYECNYLSNCTGSGAGGTHGYGFYNCSNLSTCTGKGTGTSSGYGFYNIDYAVNCKDGGSSADMWAGTNKNIDTLTCHKTATTTSNTTLNA